MDKFSLVWFGLASLVVAWDSSFVLLRPHSLPGGKYHNFYKPYALYIQIDTKYGDITDTFNYAQSCGTVPSIIYTTQILLKSKGAVLCGFMVSTMTFWKTVIYMIQYTDLCAGAHVVKHVTWSQHIGLFLIPNGIWIVVPFYLMTFYGRKITCALNNNKKQEKKSE